MKRFIVNAFATTGISLILLSMIALFYEAEYLHISTAFQTLGANVVIHLGLLFLHKLELKYLILEMTLDILVVIVALTCFGAIFNWFTSTPISILVIMGIVMYVVSLFLNLISMKQEAQEINALIKKRNKNNEAQEVQ